VVVESVRGTFDVNDLRIAESAELVENDIGVVTLRTAQPLAVDRYEADRITGSFVLIDEQSLATVAAGMVGPPRLHG
jgi:sulfate adenylyltransferase subunit 1